MVFCFDTDEAGQAARGELARQAAMRGKSVAYLPPEALGGHKDLSEAWAAGGLRLAMTQEEMDIAPKIMGEVDAWPGERREAWEEKAAFR